MDTPPPPAEAAPPSEVPPRRSKWRIALLGLIGVAGLYWALLMPRGTLHPVADGTMIEVLGANRTTTWEPGHPKATFLTLSMATTVDGVLDSARIWREAGLVLPLARSIAATTGDTIIRIERVAFPYSRMLPLRFSTYTYYHEQPDSTWVPSSTLWSTGQ